MSFNHIIKFSFLILFSINSAIFIRAKSTKDYNNFNFNQAAIISPLTNSKIAPLIDTTDSGWMAITYRFNTDDHRFGKVVVVTGTRTSYCVPQFGPNLTYIAYSYRYVCMEGQYNIFLVSFLIWQCFLDNTVQITTFSDTHCTPSKINFQQIQSLQELLATLIYKAKIKWPDTTNSISCSNQGILPIPSGVHFATN